MKCPTCVSENLTSRLRIDSMRTSGAYCPPFYDESGKMHHHDRNRKTTHYTCSNKHRWTVTTSGECWCGWGKADAT